MIKEYNCNGTYTNSSLILNVKFKIYCFYESKSVNICGA